MNYGWLHQSHALFAGRVNTTVIILGEVEFQYGHDAVRFLWESPTKGDHQYPPTLTKMQGGISSDIVICGSEWTTPLYNTCSLHL